MSTCKYIPEFTSYEEMADFWDTHGLADYWEQTEPVAFEISEQARRRYVVHIDHDLRSRVQQLRNIEGPHVG